MTTVSSPQPVTLLRLPEVIARTGLGKSTIWQRAKAGTFPKPVKLGPRTTAWVAAEIDRWAGAAIAARA